MKLYRLSIVNGQTRQDAICEVPKAALSSVAKLRHFLSVNAVTCFDGVEGKGWRICQVQNRDCLIPLCVNQIRPVFQAGEPTGTSEYGDQLIIH